MSEEDEHIPPVLIKFYFSIKPKSNLKVLFISVVNPCSQ